MRYLINSKFIISSLLLQQMLSLALFVMSMAYDVNHDAALYLQCGQLILDGKTPYVDFYDNNPPLIMYLSSIPVFFANQSGMPLYTSFAAFVLGAIVLSTYLICLLLNQNQPDRKNTPIVLSGWLFFQAIMAVSHDFGQREHLFVIFSAPYLLARMQRSESGTLAIRPGLLILIGIYASVGTCLKPYFLLILFVFESALFLNAPKKNWLVTPESIGFLAFGFFYFLFFLFSPKIRNNYLLMIAPLVADGNCAYYVSARELLSIFNPLNNMRGLYVAFSLFLFLGTSLLRKTLVKRYKRTSSASLALMIASTLSLMSYFYQAKGWPYHLIPFCFFSCLSFVWVFKEFIGSDNRFNSRDFSALFLVLILVLISTAIQCHYFMMRSSLSSSVLTILNSVPSPNRKVIVISTSMRAYPPMIQADKRPGSRFLWFFPVALLYANCHDGQLAENEIYEKGPTDKALEARFMHELSEDIQNQKPGLILIRSFPGDQGLPVNFHLKNYLDHKKIMDLIQARYNIEKSGANLQAGSSGFEIWSLKPEFAVSE